MIHARVPWSTDVKEISDYPVLDLFSGYANYFNKIFKIFSPSEFWQGIR